MNGLNAPLSPVSVGGSEWSYPITDKDGPYQNTRGQLSTPPDSAGAVRAMNGNFPPGPRSVGGPSPPPSVGRSSAGTNLYARSESGRSQSQNIDNQELVLAEHYVSLKRFLSSTSRDGKPKLPPNKARDKLQRLTGVQFLELSTDVFDELKRRELSSRRPPNAPPGSGPPDYLLPEENFHPKRNQARQKLSSLVPPRFCELATDVFCELERRFPRFAVGDIPRVGSPVSVRGGPSRSQTPVNGMNGGFPPRGASRRRPSEASSIRSGRGLPTPLTSQFPVPPSPGLPNGDYNRPMAKQFQSNTIVPNKSTMVEEDDDAISPMSPDPAGSDVYGMRRTGDRDSKRSAGPSETDKKLIEDYEQQVRDLREKLDNMEDALKKKDDDLISALDGERSRATASNAEKREWDDARNALEDKLAEAQEMNESLKRELDRIRDEHEEETQRLRELIEEARQSSANAKVNDSGNPELERENRALRAALEEQEQVTEEVRREAQEFLREMRNISQQSGASWERQSEMESTIETLEKEVKEWRNRYARAKTQLRDLRGSSTGLPVDHDAGKYVREKGFTQDNGLVKDVHVTKFQIAIDELLQRARVEDPERVIDSMKAVVVSVRRITKDIDESAQNNPETLQQNQKLKARVSSTANNLITASKAFASSAGISPVSLLDAAASHLVTAVVELLRVAKIRSTPDGELEDDDDGTITPVESTSFFSPRSNGQSQMSRVTSGTGDSLPRPPPFQGLGAPSRTSLDSSAYSPVSSPRESYNKGSMTNGNGGGYGGLTNGGPVKNPSLAPNGNGPYNAPQRDTRSEDLKIYLEDQTAVLVQTIQDLVQLIRNDADINQVTEEINTIVDVVGQVVQETESTGSNGVELVRRLSACRDRLMEAGKRGLDLAADGKDSKSREWRMWTQTLPPIAFEIARETKELVQRVDQLVIDDGSSADDFA
ncbi:protein SPA2 [Podospora australis]|uniref:Protein SPA2 n=1 Tax=Podospora australis TaxID=1536484 RepID=A0AAN6X1P7_9PEZI|nr:protein SPA2 [Podospora australis]